MKILHRYILTLTLKNLAVSLAVFTFLFLILDFFERIDNIISEGASVGTTLLYFLYKLPLMVSLMLPVAMLVTTVWTFGILSKNSEITAMRAAGLKLFWLARPLFVVAAVLSLFTILLNESIVPYSTRRTKEIYNIDIRQKDKRGGYSQENIWWRAERDFFAVEIFDSRSNTLHNLSRFTLGDDFEVSGRTDAERARWIDSAIGWNMDNVRQYDFDPKGQDAPAASQPESMRIKKFQKLPLPIRETPEDFYDRKTDPQTMSFRQLRRFIKAQRDNGIKVSEYLPDLWAKFSVPFACLIVCLAALPFSVRSARGGSMAGAVAASIIISFLYYAMHSFSIALGRAELWPPIVAAWMANVAIGFVGIVLSLGAEAP